MRLVGYVRGIADEAGNAALLYSVEEACAKLSSGTYYNSRHTDSSNILRLRQDIIYEL